MGYGGLIDAHELIIMQEARQPSHALSVCRFLGAQTQKVRPLQYCLHRLAGAVWGGAVCGVLFPTAGACLSGLW